MAVGSGGSLTVAHVAALLHRSAGSCAIAVTPFELVRSVNSLRESSALILSAEGNNKDILSAFEWAAVSEPRFLAALCMQQKNRLSEVAANFRYASFMGFDLPAGRDGFLATNSLLAASVIMVRAYQELFPDCWCALPDRGSIGTIDEKCCQIDEYGISPSLNKRNSWVTLFGGWGQPAATDIESKFTEAALGTVQLADYRNFGHGRHNWLAKRGSETLIIALITPDEEKIANKTLSLLPHDVPIIRLMSDKTGPAGAIELLIKVLHVVSWLGVHKGVDPGKPRVPVFGRRIYGLGFSIRRQYPWLRAKIPTREAVAILRKTHCPSFCQIPRDELTLWRQYYHSFVRKLEDTCFGSVVFDYDGTLCDPSERYCGLSSELAKQLVHILDAKIVIGVATGRGQSVRNDLARSIPERLLRRIIVGYYNGADIGGLDVTEVPNKQCDMHNGLQTIKTLIEQNPFLLAFACYDYRPHQITVQPSSPIVWNRTRIAINDVLRESMVQGIRLLESSHSIDIIPAEVSKLNLVESCRIEAQKLGNTPAVLCIGDKGQWPGNDYELLSTPCSLSVDQVSSCPNTCWNLSKPGHRGVQATMGYLRQIDAREGILQFKLVKS